MLIPQQDGLMVGRKQQMLDGVVPSEQEYGSAPVYRERTWPGRPTAGFGERVQSSFGDRRYYWGMDVQVLGGLFGKGPLLHPIVPTSAAGGQVYKFLDAPNASGVQVQVILAGTKVYTRTDDTNSGQTVSKDFTPAALQDGVVFQGGFAGAAASLYVATNSGQLWERTPAGVWTQCALPAGFGGYRVEVVGTELWAADVVNSVVRKCTADPKVAGSWSGPILIGTPAVQITSIRQTANQLVIFKADGSVFTLNSDGSCNDLFPGLRVPMSAVNGYRAAPWLNALWFRAGPTFYKLEMPGAVLNPVGPGKLVDNASPVQGDAVGFAGWGGYRAYLVIYDPNGSPPASYLLRYGDWQPNPQAGGTVSFVDQWDGAEAHWNNRQASAIGVSGASGVDRLYIGFTDGGWDWFKLVRNPLATGPFGNISGAEYSLGPCDLVFPTHHAMFAADLKHWLGFSIFGPFMKPGDEATLAYRIMASAGAPPTDPLGNWLPLGEFTANGQRIPAPSNLVGNSLQLKVSLSNTTTADTPVVEVVAIHERVVPAFKRDLSFTIDARGFSTRMDGAVNRYQADKTHQALLDFAATPGSMAAELPDETISEVAMFGYMEHLAPTTNDWAIDVQMTQFKILTIYGIVGRLRGTSVGDLRGYKISALRTL